MLFLNRATALNFDDMLAQQNFLLEVGGTSYGVFENSEEMALEFRISLVSEEVLMTSTKLTWKYLNDASTRGGSGNFR